MNSKHSKGFLVKKAAKNLDWTTCIEEREEIADILEREKIGQIDDFDVSKLRSFWYNFQKRRFVFKSLKKFCMAYDIFCPKTAQNP